MQSCGKIKRLIIFVGVIGIILSGCSLVEKTEATKQKENTNVDEKLSDFMLFVSETDNCRVLSMTAIVETPDVLLQQEGKYQFLKESESGNEVTLCCDGMNDIGHSKYKIILSLCDSEAKFLCTYTFRDVSLSNNAHIDLSNMMHGELTIFDNNVENHYTGIISAIS